MDVAPWCYKWMDWMDGLDGSPGGVRYRAPYGAKKVSRKSFGQNWILGIL